MLARVHAFVLQAIAAATLLNPLLSAQTIPSSQPSSNQRTYKNPAYHFSIVVPTLSNTTLGPAIFRSAEEDGISSNVVVMVQPQKRTIDEYYDVGIKGIKDGGSIVNESKKMKLADHDAAFVDYQSPVSEKRQLRFLTLAVLTADRVYLITCTSTLKNFARHEKEFRACLDSFTPTAFSSTATYVDDDQNFSISPPPFTEASGSAIPALFRSEDADKTTASITVTINPPTTRKDSTDNFLALLSLQNGTVKKQEETNVAGVDAVVLDWEQISDNGTHHRFLALKIFAKTHTYSILCTTENVDNFALHEAQFHHCLNSFKLDQK